MSFAEPLLEEVGLVKSMEPLEEKYRGFMDELVDLKPGSPRAKEVEGKLEELAKERTPLSTRRKEIIRELSPRQAKVRRRYLSLKEVDEAAALKFLESMAV